jgi:GTPase SAR1 family protein
VGINVHPASPQQLFAVLEIIDTAGQEEYKTLRDIYFKCVVYWLLVSSVRSRSTNAHLPDRVRVLEFIGLKDPDGPVHPQDSDGFVLVYSITSSASFVVIRRVLVSVACAHCFVCGF